MLTACCMDVEAGEHSACAVLCTFHEKHQCFFVPMVLASHDVTSSGGA